MPEPETVLEGQEQGQEVQPEIQPETVGDEALGCRVRYDMFENLGVGHDINKAIHLGKQYKEAEQSGLVALGQTIADMGMNPYTLLAELTSGEEAPAPAPAPAQQQPQQQPQQQVQSGQPPPEQQGQGLYKTQEEFDQAVDARVDTKMSKGFADERQQQDTNKALDAQGAAVSASLDGLGYKSEPAKFTLSGTDHELTPVRDLLIRPAIMGVAQRIHAQGLNPNAPDYQERLYAPMSAKTIEEATNHVKQVLALIGQQQLETEADNQADLPQGSLDHGAPGGSVKKNPADMTEAEVKAAVDTHVATARAQRGG